MVGLSDYEASSKGNMLLSYKVPTSETAGSPARSGLSEGCSAVREAHAPARGCSTDELARWARRAIRGVAPSVQKQVRDGHGGNRLDVVRGHGERLLYEQAAVEGVPEHRKRNGQRQKAGHDYRELDC